MRDEQLVELALDAIIVREDRVTPLNESAVAMLMQSVEETGEIRDPIHVRKVKAGYELIDGRHRLEIAKRSGRETILAHVWACTLEQARLMEADANVTFSHFDPLDLAVSLSRRKRAYVQLHPETRRGAAGAASRFGMQRTEMSFASFMGEVVGVTDRQIRRIVAAGDALDAKAVSALKRAPARITMADLYQLAKVGEPEEREAIIKMLVAGEAKSAAEAHRAWAEANSEAEPAVKDPVEEAFKALFTAWKRAPRAARKRFLAEAHSELYPLMVAGTDGSET